MIADARRGQLGHVAPTVADIDTTQLQSLQQRHVVLNVYIEVWDGL